MSVVSTPPWLAHRLSLRTSAWSVPGVLPQGRLTPGPPLQSTSDPPVSPPNRRGRPLPKPTELRSSFLLCFPYPVSADSSRCYSCCVFSRLGHFPPETVSNLFSPPPACTFPLCFPSPSVAESPLPRSCWSLGVPHPHRHRPFPFPTPSPLFRRWRTHFLASSSFHQWW